MSVSDNYPRNGLEIAVIGMAGRFPGACNIREFWRNLCSGVESISFFSDAELLEGGADPEVLAYPSYVRARGIVDGADLFDAPLFGLNPREAELMDPQHRFLLECSWEALEDAGYDPDRFPRPIGMYAGVSQSWYFLSQLYRNPDLMRTVGLAQAMLGNERDFLTTRVSYKLNLGGPSITVQTACSTSLVAIHLASQGLLSGECDMALAGGVSIRVPQRAGYVYQAGGIVSPDGHCRAFDARAAGTVSGDGIGIVVLKRLEDALADRDPIRAVIKGSAVNNDGARRIGYTAPSVEGQRKVIQAALASADVDPATVTYIEAHGAATALGDPTEVAALTEVFRDSGRALRSCALGSVKTNVGHLDAAAGVTGFIKTALAIEHGLLPPSLHFEQPNPEIDFASGPFYVNTALQPWDGNGVPRRAGVSSFGLGGTNAHVLLEAPPAPEPSVPSPASHHLLLLSGHTPAALDALGAVLAAHLRESPDVDLADVAYTLQVGRRNLGCRRALVVSSIDEAVAALEGRDARLVLSDRAPAERSLAFLLSGLGEQYAGMARELYEREPAFRQPMDLCCDLLEPRLGVDLREVLQLGGSAVSVEGPQEPENALRAMLRRARGAAAGSHAGPQDRLHQTLIAQPAVFAVGYALAQMWISWGIRPRALIGYSLGEYLAACLAGVLSLEDALLLVAERARLIQELPEGSMLAVPLSSGEIAPLLENGLALAAANSPELSVVSGPAAVVAGLAERLLAQGVASRPLQTSHAFHSPAMEPAVPRFLAALGQVHLAPPAIPFLSNVTGEWVRDGEVTDPDYWVRHLCGTVRFSEGVSRLLEEDGLVLLEVGPGRTLSTFARQHQDTDEGRVVLTSLRQEDEAGSDTAHVLRTLGRLWLSGVAVDWDEVHRHEARRRVHLPTYPFDRQRYWIDWIEGAEGLRELAAAPEAQAAPVLGLYHRPALQTAYVEPRSDAEEAVVAVWQQFLGVRQIGVHDGFFELGGHSLLATRVAAKLRDVFAVEVPLRLLTDAPTPAELAAALEALRAIPGSAPLVPLPRAQPDRANWDEPFPLTDVQQAYWIGRSQILQLGNVATHAYVEQEVKGLDVERLQLAWRRLIDRHGMLRAVFLPDGRQRILPEVPPFTVEVLDLAGKDPGFAASELGAIRQRMSHQVLPDDRWPLFEVRASVLDDGWVRLHKSFDFLIFDAWSLDILFQELQLFYDDPQAAPEPIEISFRDYVLAEQSLRETELYERSRRYWLERLESLPPAPELPLAKSPAEVARPSFVGRSSRLEAELWSRLKARVNHLGITPTAFLVTAFSEVLAVWSKVPRFSLNLTLFNRLPLHPQVDRLLGDFSSLSLLSVDHAVGETFEERVRRVQIQLWDDLDHRYFSGVQVMRELGRARGSLQSALMPVVLTSTVSLVRKEREPEKKPARDEDRSREAFRITQTPQIWLDHQITEQDGALIFNWDAVEELFPEGLLDDMFAAYCRLLRRLGEDEEAWREQSFALMPAAQLEQRREVNATAAPVPEGLLHTRFEEQAARQPRQPAVLSGSRTITYEELRRCAARIGQRLRDAGARPGSLVAVAMDKGWEQVAAVLGVLQAGAAYLPVDPSLPEERLRYLLAQGEVRWVLTRGHPAGGLAWPPEIEPVVVDEGLLAGGDCPSLAPAQAPEDLAYVIYTSGSTGLPKGVAIEHQAALNTILDVNRRFGIGPQDRVLALSSLSFDLSVHDIFGTLAAGGTLVMPPPSATRDPGCWADLIARHGVTVWNSVPALLQLLTEHAESHADADLGSLRLALLSGDWIPVTLPDRFRARASAGVQVISLGGATEAAIWSILHPVGEVDPAWTSIPYGRPMDNQRCHVLDEWLRPCPVWVPGQLYIAGTGLARGYWRDEERTRASFLVHPRTGERLYRTGDWGRFLPDGNIEFLGREDFQVKIQGFRIELEEIEAALLQHPGVSAAAVSALGERTNRRLVGYAVPAPGHSPDAEALREHLQARLPSYMVPASFVLLERLPLTANGKVDRSALPEPGAAAAKARREGAPTETAARVLRVLEEALQVPGPIDIGGSLIELGATSIEIIRLANLLHKEFRFQPETERLFTLASVEELVDYYEERLPEMEKAVRPAAAAPAREDPFAAWYKVVLDPEERDRFKERRPGLRRFDRDSTAAGIALPAPAHNGHADRRSYRRFGEQPLALESLGGLLGGLCQFLEEGEPRFRHASAGGLYPVRTYVYVKEGRVEGLGGGTYYHDPVSHRLVPLVAGAEIDRSIRGVHGWINLPIFDQSAFSLFLIADMAAIGPMYGPVARDYCLIEAGLQSQILETVAPAHRIGLCQIGMGGVEFHRIRHLFALEESHLCTHSLIGGPIDPSLGRMASEVAAAADWEEGEL